jgi:hypothetical protein
VERRGDWLITLSDTRVVLRGSMFPMLVKHRNGSLTLNAALHQEHSPRTAIRSDNNGHTWRRSPIDLPEGAGGNFFDLPDGRTISLWYHTTPIADEPGMYTTTRWESRDAGHTLSAPITDGRLFLPPERFDAAKPQWFHGNVVALSQHRLLAVMQGVERSDHAFYPFQVFVSESIDGGTTWRYLSHVASLDTLVGLTPSMTAGWRLHGPCEPNIVHLGNDTLLCAMRLVNDDLTPPLSEPSETYHDLSYTVAAEDLHPDQSPTRTACFYSLSQRSAPLILSRSIDGGRTWSPAAPMTHACGCFPRLARDESGLIALTYGALTFPRWGNAITFSADNGTSWTDEINFAPFLSTGYTDIVALSPGHFLCTFDCTPPQPWTNHIAHWVGAIDIHIQRASTT